MNWRRLLLGVGVAVLLVAGGVFTYFLFFAPPPTETPTEVAPTAETAGRANHLAGNSAVNAVSAEGQIVPLRQARLAFATTGAVTEILALPGTIVAVGDPLLRLDTADQEAALAQAESQLAQAEANVLAAQAALLAAQTGAAAAELGVRIAEVELELATAEPTPEEIALRESQVALANARIGQATAAQQLVLDGVAVSQIRQAEADLRAAEARVVPAGLRLDQLRRLDEPNSDALAQAQRDYDAAVAAVEAATIAFEELQAGATGAQRQAVGSGVTAATAQRDAAQAELDLLLAGNRAEQVAIAEAGLAQAEGALAEAQARMTQSEASLTQAEADVLRVQAAIVAAQTALDDRTLFAPFAGTVADLLVETGEVINAGVPALILADFSRWLVETTDLTELDVVAVVSGDPARIRIDALPDVTLAGTVGDGSADGIAELSQELRGDVVYTVTIQLDEEPDIPLRWGMTVFVTIDTGR
jgi:HlyD family secretion protein